MIAEQPQGISSGHASARIGVRLQHRDQPGHRSRAAQCAERPRGLAPKPRIGVVQGGDQRSEGPLIARTAQQPARFCPVLSRHLVIKDRQQVRPGTGTATSEGGDVVPRQVLAGGIDLGDHPLNDIFEVIHHFRLARHVEWSSLRARPVTPVSALSVRKAWSERNAEPANMCPAPRLETTIILHAESAICDARAGPAVRSCLGCQVLAPPTSEIPG